MKGKDPNLHTVQYEREVTAQGSMVLILILFTTDDDLDLGENLLKYTCVSHMLSQQFSYLITCMCSSPRQEPRLNPTL